MAYGLDDRVREQGTHSGTGAVTLPNSAVSGFQTFLSGWGASGTGEYCIVIGLQWETGFGTLNAGGTSLTRTTVYDGSSGSGVAVNFSSGTADIHGTIPAELAHHLNVREITVASATTCDIGAVRSSRIIVSGTTTITGLGTSANRRRFVRFSGALILTYNATSLILPGAANITTVAGDTAIFESDASGNWRCVDYVRGSRGTLGTATNDNASTGDVGQVVESTVASGSAVSISNGLGGATQVTSISLTAGDWDVFAAPHFVTSGGTNCNFISGISTASGARGGEEGYMTNINASGSGTFTVAPIQVRISLSATTTYYLNGAAGFSAGTVTCYGRLTARRRR